MLYPSRKIRCIGACTSQKTTKETRSDTLYPGKTNTSYSSLRKKYRLNLKNDMPPRDKLEEEKARWHGKVYNWETAKYGKIWYDEDVHDLRSVEAKLPAIVTNDELSFEKTLSCEATISSLNNNEIYYRTSFDESDDEDYTVVFDKNSFSYKIISVNDFKTDLENDNEKSIYLHFHHPSQRSVVLMI
nr:hypothetical protein [Tanacetum cinerariifolium]